MGFAQNKQQLFLVFDQLERVSVFSLTYETKSETGLLLYVQNFSMFYLQIIETDNLMDLLVISLHETDNNKLQMAAVGCLHSLSRYFELSISCNKRKIRPDY